MTVEIVVPESTNLFVGTEATPRQVVRLTLRGGPEPNGREPAKVRVVGDRLHSPEPLIVGPLGRGDEVRLEIGVIVDGAIVAGDVRDAVAIVEDGAATARQSFSFVVVEPGWRMFMISHFHYDPVWWNTQAAYTEAWGTAIQYRSPFQEPGLALVKAHLEACRRDPDYKFVLAELDYLKPYWAVFPEDRAYVRQLLAEARLELMGGTYNEPNTNLTSDESTIRNAIYGVGYQRDVLGGSPETAWQLDAFGHGPQFPAIMADAGITSSSWARGPFHEWGPHWVRGPARTGFEKLAPGDIPRMQFASEFEWVAPSGRGLLTSYQANHYSAGWWMDAAATLEEAELEVHRLFTDLAELAATKNVLLPVGTDYSPPNKWLTAIHRDWARRYVWPKFLAAIPREFFDAVREERSSSGRSFVPQTRDMNPVYTGKDVSFIDTKQAQRSAENTLLAAEKFASLAMLLGARFPTLAIDKAWRQLLFGAHHDGITGSESDQVYLDLLGGWREALELGKASLDGALGYLAARADTGGDGRPIVVFNAMAWPRTDITRVVVELAEGAAGIELRDESGSGVPFVTEAVEPGNGRGPVRARIAFLARDVPACGYRTYRALSSSTPLDKYAWRITDGDAIENDGFRLEIDRKRGGAIRSLRDMRAGKELILPGRVGNEILAYREYPNHPIFGEGPWHLTPAGTWSSSSERPAEGIVEASAIGWRVIVEGEVEGCRLRQDIVLWDQVDRVEFTTRLDDFAGHDRLFRVRFPIAVEGGRPISEVGNAVVARPFGFPNVDVGQAPFTLDNPAYNWFGLGVTARVELKRKGSPEDRPRANAIGVAEVIVVDDVAYDDAVRDLVVALVRQGITSTVTRHDGSRYGVLHIDSNLPDVRLVIGVRGENVFLDQLLEEAGPRYAEELARQLSESGSAQMWVPAERPSGGRLEPIQDLRGVRDLPVLVVSGVDGTRTAQAIEALVADLAHGAVVVEQPSELDEVTGHVDNHTVAVLNRGLPGFNVEADGSLYLSLLRSCSGWPSGVWIDPPRRSLPDGSNFQFQHWSHTFEYALTSSAGDWRAGQTVRSAHDFNNPLIARLADVHSGMQSSAASFIRIESSSIVLTAVKPSGNPLARLAGADVNPAEGLVLRLYESAGRPTTALIRCAWPIGEAEVTTVAEEGQRALTVVDGSVAVDLEPFEIATLRLTLASRPEASTATELGPGREAAQPVFAGYWLHNKGPAPMGYQPLTVQVRPWRLEGPGPFDVRVLVASERTDAPVAGTVSIVAPPGWQVTPAERPYRLAPGAHLDFEARVVPAPEAPSGRYFVAAQIGDDDGQIHEDVVRVDLTAVVGDARPSADGEASMPPLTFAIVRALRGSDVDGDAVEPAPEPGDDPPDRELEVLVLGRELRLTAGAEARLRVRIRNRTESEIRGEAQVLSPHETWGFIGPWTQGFAVGAGEEQEINFRIAPPFDTDGGTYWALVKVMWFGRLAYTESVALHLSAAEGVQPRASASHLVRS
jgi:alpha-mannosidase